MLLYPTQAEKERFSEYVIRQAFNDAQEKIANFSPTFACGFAWLDVEAVGAMAKVLKQIGFTKVTGKRNTYRKHIQIDTQMVMTQYEFATHVAKMLLEYARDKVGKQIGLRGAKVDYILD
jgi:hypothetical protein